LEQAVHARGGQVQSRGAVVLGTVFGDLHSIGKSMVRTMIYARGFRVIDAGINVPAEKFVEAVQEHQPDILAMSALLTITAPEQAKVIRALETAGLRQRVKVLVGGGAITPEFAKKIGADAYGATAVGAAEICERLMGG
jgi:5-methyltetrahydrofolate--homocysteine methyltransferase